MSLSVRIVLPVAALGLLSFGCNKDTAKPASSTPTATAPAPGAARAAPAAAHAGEVTGGVVLETMDGGGYTYAKLDVGGSEVWVAGPQTQVAVGQQVSVGGGSLMRDFHSKTLGRTFAEIHFVSSLGSGAAAAPAGHGGVPGHGGMPGHGDMPAAGHGATAPTGHGGAPAAPAAPAEAVEAVAPAPGGTPVVDLFAKSATLSGKPVILRGKVVKFNAGIMGRNWLHLQDGSGGNGTNDITITTNGMAAVGDVVTVKGTLNTNRDFGAGYSYAVIVEDATVEAK